MEEEIGSKITTDYGSFGRSDQKCKWSEIREIDEKKMNGNSCWGVSQECNNVGRIHENEQ